jgi:hypothetical protein
MGGEAPALQGVAAFGHIAPPVIAAPKAACVPAGCFEAGGCASDHLVCRPQLACAEPAAQARLRLERRPAARWQREDRLSSRTLTCYRRGRR